MSRLLTVRILAAVSLVGLLLPPPAVATSVAQARPAPAVASPQPAPQWVGSTYYWRVRPRVQGDGVPVDWSDTWSFTTP